MVIGCMLWGSFHFLLIQQSGGWGADWFLGPMGPPALSEFQAASSQGVGGENRNLNSWVQACSGGFQGPSDPSGEGCLGAWLYFTGSISIAGFIKLLLPFFSEMQDCLVGRPGRSGP